MISLTVTNFITAVGFAAALVAVVTMPTRPAGFARGGIKFILGGAMAIYVFVGTSHVLQYTNVTAAFDVYENYLKVLFIPLIAYAAFAVRVNEELRETERNQRVLAAEHDMLMRVVDTTPTGVAIVDCAGRIEFANDRAQSLLGLAEDRDTGSYAAPKWVCTWPGDGAPMRDFSFCLADDVVRDFECTVRWPDGRRLPLLMNATTFRADDGTVGGAVIAFTERAGVAVG